MIKKMKKYIVIWILILSGACNDNIIAQSISLETRIDSNIILIGDQINLEFKVRQNREAQVQFPEFRDTLTQEIDLIETLSKDTNWINESEYAVSQKYRITSFDSGYAYIPSFQFPVKTQYGADTLHSKPLYLEVKTIPDTSKTKLMDIKKPFDAPLSFKEIAPYLLYGVLGILIILLIIYLIRKKKKKEPVFKPAKPSEPAHILAIRELEQLKNKKLWQKGETKAYHSELTEIIRKYIERRFQVPAMEQTSDEILEVFDKNKYIDEDSRKELEEMFRTADLVKFAKASPLPDENENCYQRAYNFVRRTRWEEINNEKQNDE